jgi:hypothetical protein
MAIIKRGIDGTRVYLISVSYLPKYGLGTFGTGCETEREFVAPAPSLLRATMQQSPPI